MTPMDIEFCYKMLLVFVASTLIFFFMKKLQNRRQKELDTQCALTIKMIDIRNKKYTNPKLENNAKNGFEEKK